MNKNPGNEICLNQYTKYRLYNNNLKNSWDCHFPYNHTDILEPSLCLMLLLTATHVVGNLRWQSEIRFGLMDNVEFSIIFRPAYNYELNITLACRYWAINYSKQSIC